MSGTSFVTLYRGRTISSARLVAVSADRQLAADVAARMHGQPLPSDDRVIDELERGRRAALRIVQAEVHDGSGD